MIQLLNTFHPDSTRYPLDQIIEDQAEDGYFRAVRNSLYRHWEFNLIWEYQPHSYVQSVISQWNNIHEQRFDYTWPLDNKVYSCNFTTAPKISLQAYNFWKVEVNFTGKMK